MRRVLQRLWWIGVGAAVAGCPDTSCPPGSISGAAGRCLPGRDGGVDAFGTPDACTLNAHYVDRDGDGHGAGEPMLACPAPGLSLLGDDCDDEVHARRPGGIEVCDGVDDDCDGAVDEGVQRVLGMPLAIEEDGLPAWLDATRVGDAYVVVWNGESGVYARRYDRLGSSLGASVLVSSQASDSFVRVLERDATTAVVAFRTSDPPGLHAAILDTSVEPMTVGASVPLGEGETSTTVGLAWDDGLSVVSVTAERDIPLARAFDTNLAPLGTDRMLESVYGSQLGLLVGPDSLYLVSTGGLSLFVHALRRDTFATIAAGNTSGEGALPFAAALDPAGLVRVLRSSPAGLVLATFARERGGMEETFFTRELALSLDARWIATAIPSVLGHEAGLDVALVNNDVSTQMGVAFVTTDDQIAWGYPTVSSEAIGIVRGARLSSRDGALFFVTIRGGDARLEMQRIGCE